MIQQNLEYDEPDQLICETGLSQDWNVPMGPLVHQNGAWMKKEEEKKAMESGQWEGHRL